MYPKQTLNAIFFFFGLFVDVLQTQVGASGVYQAAEMHLQLTNRAGANQVKQPEVRSNNGEMQKPKFIMCTQSRFLLVCFLISLLCHEKGYADSKCGWSGFFGVCSRVGSGVIYPN